MLNNKQTVNQNIDIPTNNQIKCAYCKSMCVQLDGAWPTFICTSCGGKCILKCREIDDQIDECSSWIIWDVKSITWTKVNFNKKL